ncbi:neutral/alkaline non-lysosomal ceramidase N-terminal domain-containing protein [Horticoccus sp. 23ND18S-11]|uniref:neutral/alkaline non-lysosomal ceramidase N-terminal domain-containing protein n=1 Tax=Horticoccus sp. 23ND18S-11 TaxID=3391832 RepID=UPI0039C97A59
MISRSGFLFALLVAGLVAVLPVTTSAAEAGWKAGTATVDITPVQKHWMSGYGGRDHPAEGTLHPLFVRVLAIEDASGHRAIVATSDLLGIPQTIYDNVSARLKRKFGLKRDQIMLHASHSHCTPVLRGALYDAYPLPNDQRPVIEKYSDELEQKYEDTVGLALSRLAPATVAAGQGVTRFAVNRRNNPEAIVPKLIAEQALKGPVDHSVPVLSVKAADGKVMAVVFGYACHNTTLSFYKWAGDYAGFAQMALERSHPGAVAMFYMGCGADQNPLPRREVFQAERYGQMLASAVEEVLLQSPAPLPAQLATSHAFATLKLGAAPTIEELEKAAQEKPSTLQRWSVRLLADLKAGKTLERSYRYPVQVWQLGGRQLWIALGGEVVVDYALRFKQEFGAGTWVAGYANDVMAYIPSARVLAEDKPPRTNGRPGYEGNTSMYVYGLPAHTWADDVEHTIATSVQQQVQQLKAAGTPTKTSR